MPRYAAAAPPGFGPGVVRTAMARGHDLEDEAAVRARVDERRPPERAHRADDRQLVVAALAAERPGRVDQAVAAAVGEADREDRLAAGPDLGDPRALLERRS